MIGSVALMLDKSFGLKTQARLVWDKTTTEDESLCGQPLPAGSPQPAPPLANRRAIS